MSDDGLNPWPENSDYGKRWRQGFEAGRCHTVRRLTASFIALAKARAASPTPNPHHPPEGE